MKKREFSKLIIIWATAVNFFVVVFTCVMVWLTRDMSPLCYLIPSVAGEVAAGTTFYYKKAETENKIKLSKKYDVSLEEMRE